MTLNDAANMLTDKFNFPFQVIKPETGLNNNCLYIAISLDNKKDWNFNIFENSRCVKCLVQPVDYDSTDLYQYTFLINHTGTRLMNQKRGKSLADTVNAVCRQLSKLEE